MTRPTRTRTRLAVATAATAVLVAACANDGGRTAPPPTLNVSLVAALEPFDRCDDFLAYVKEQAAEQVGAYGLDGGMYYVGDMPVSASAREDMATTDATSGSGSSQSKAAESAPATTASSQSATDSAAGTDGTGTNNQEAGVDEADLVKTDGSRIVTVQGNELVVVSLTGGAPYVTAKVDLGSEFSGDRLFLLPDRAYVLGYASMPVTNERVGDTTAGATDSMYSGGGAAIVEVSLSGDAPTVAHRTQLEGNILDGRLANGVVRLVLSTPGGSGLGFVYPSGSDERSLDRAAETNRTVVEESQLDDWLPSASTDGGDAAPLLDCDHLYRPSEPSGFSMLSILTIDDGLGSLTGSGVLADGQTTYASNDHLYVATNRWDDALPDGAVAKRAPGSTSQHTDVHSFSIAGTEPAAYEASGRVEGHVLNQYSMSESGDDLRIATTVDTGGGIAVPMPMPVECPPNASCAVPMEDTATTSAPPQVGDSRIVVLRRQGNLLKEVGKVGGLGATEQIKSVRYVGDTAYVVTFRRTDPFYVVDLSDPTSPEVMGELKVPGFSSYLHPVGEHLVLGVGSDATDQGRVTGAKLSLYDTTDPVNPKELTNWTSKELGFMVDGDPHAFSWDAGRQTAYLPYYASCYDDFGRCDVSTNGVMVVRVADGAITELGRITHEDRTPSPTPAPEPSTTTTTPETTTTTVPETTTVPDTTTPETTVPVTTIPVTTVPTTVAERDDTGSGIGGSDASGPDIASAPSAPPDIICDPAACDPAPYPYPYNPTITRVFVIGDRIITLSDVGIAAHDVADRRLVGYAAF